MEVLTHIGRYRIESELGRGSMGVVFKAFDPVVERSVAVKTIPLNVENPELLVHRLQREAKSIGQLEHPNIVTLYDAGEASGLFYMAMQFIQGETLRDRMTRQRWFSLQEIQAFFRQICAALDYAHQRGVVHRDIKPSNIMITPEDVAKLTDFGIAKLAGRGTTTPGMIMGTPSYMSPEQALGKPLDGRSDIFSLGSILYELITGEQAFAGLSATTVMYKIVHEPPSALAASQPGIDPVVEAMVLKTLAKQPEQRYQTCAELSAALDYCVSRAGAGAPQTLGGGERAGVPSVAPVVQAPTPNLLSASLPEFPSMASQAAAATQVPRHRSLLWLTSGVLVALFLLAGIWGVMQLRRSHMKVSSSAPGAASSSTLPSTALVPPSSATPPSVKPLGSASSATRAGLSARPSSTPSSPSPMRKPKATAPDTPVRVQPATTGPAVLAPPLTEGTSVVPTRPAAPQTERPQPETVQGYMLKGDLAFQQSHYEDALAAYSKANQINTNNPEVRRKMVVTLTLLGRAAEAQRYK